MKQVLWWLCLLIAPLVLIGLELFHPAGFTTTPGMYQFLSHSQASGHSALGYFGPTWWFVLHMVQTPTVGLVAVGLWLMVDDVGASDGAAAIAAARLARVAIFVFAVYFTVLDGIGGIGLGRTILVVERLVAEGKLTPQQFEGVVLLLDTMWVDPMVGGIGSLVSEAASWAAFAAAFLIAVSLRLSSRVGWGPVVLLIAFGWELQTAHASPHGPIAFSLLIVAAAWTWWSQRRPA
ncbi:MAG: hypothetical protein U1E60_15120 [Reyranellaceae bacterium]